MLVKQVGKQLGRTEPGGPGGQVDHGTAVNPCSKSTQVVLGRPWPAGR